MVNHFKWVTAYHRDTHTWKNIKHENGVIQWWV